MTTSADESAMLAAIAANLEDDTVRLAYADWLDEQKDADKSDRAELIRIQCEKAKGPPECRCFLYGCHEALDDSEDVGCFKDWNRIVRREKELIAAHPEWTRWPCPECKGAGYAGGRLCRACSVTGDLLRRWVDIDYEMQVMKTLPLEWDRGWPGWVTLPTWGDAVEWVNTENGLTAPLQNSVFNNSWKQQPTPRLRALAQTPPWGVPLRGVRIAEAKPDVSGDSFWWWRDSIARNEGQAGVISSVFNCLNDTNILGMNGKYYPTERAALDDLGAAVLKFGKRI